MDVFNKPLSAEEKEFILTEIEASACKISEACKSKLVKDIIEHLKRENAVYKAMLSKDKSNEIKGVEL